MAEIYCDMPASAVHEEDRELVERLARLQNMFNQMFQLRTLLPERLISPIKQATASVNVARHPISPEALAAQLRKVAVQGNQEVQAFKKDWHSEEMKALWEKAGKETYPQGLDAWIVDYEALVREMGNGASALQPTAPEGKEEIPPVEEDLTQVVRNAQDTYKQIKIAPLDDTGAVPLDLKVAGMNFRIAYGNGGSSGEYEVSERPGSDSSELSRAILRHLRHRQEKQSLSYLVVFLSSICASMLADHEQSLLASYVDVRTHACDKCHSIFDSKLELATVKVPLQTLPGNTATWSSFHPGCA